MLQLHLYRLICFCKVLHSEFRSSVLDTLCSVEVKDFFRRKQSCPFFRGGCLWALTHELSLRKLTISHILCLLVKGSSSKAIIYCPISLRKSEGESGENKLSLFPDLEFLCTHLVFSVFPEMSWARMVGIIMTILLFTNKGFLWGGTFNHLVMIEGFLRIH